ncbi:MAG: M1 family metallopeptidase [Fimbriimonas sp.]|nr:M1 family metallopeptidase [Fimbriimonas sp.]
MLRSFRILPVLALLATVCLAGAAEVKHNYDLKNVLWRLSFSMTDGTIAGDVTNTVTMTEDSPTVQLSCSELNITATSVNGVIATFTNNDDVLTITLPKPAHKGDTLDVRSIYTGAPVNGLYFVPASRASPAHTGMIYTQGEGEDNHYWLPTYDKPDDKATTECYVTVPPTWTAISNGKLIGEQTTGEGKVFHYKMDQPYSTYLISLVAGEYVEGKDHWHDIPVSYYVPPGLEREGKASFGNTPMMIDYYSKLTGVDYPYAKFAQDTVGDFMFGGMENVTCVTQTIRTLHALGTEPVNDSTGLVAHELAHHWFGDLITCQTWEHTWLNEGFATNLPVYLDREMHGKDAFDMDRYGSFEGAVDSIGSRNRKDVPGTVGSVPTVTMGSPYAGGCSRLLMLMHMLGEPTFWKGVHEFLEKYKFQPATTDEFFEVMSKVSKVDLAPFAKQWFHSAATPSLTVAIAGADLDITQLQPYYTLDLPVWFLETPVQTTLFSAPTWTKKLVHVSGADTKVKIGDLAKSPCLVDPEAWTAMELKYAAPYTTDQIMQLYKNAPNIAEKARLIDEFYKALPLPQRLIIGRTERNVALQQKLAHETTQDAIALLSEYAANPDKRVVNAAVIALGALNPDPKLKARVQAIADKDSNESVREHATQALLNWSTDDKLAQKAWKMHAFDDGYRQMALNWWAQHSADLARTTSLDVLKSPDSEPLRVTALQVLGTVKERPGEHAVYDALITVAKETSFSARRTAINSLAQLGNKAAIPVLQPFTQHGPGGIRGAASAAIATLSK